MDVLVDGMVLAWLISGVSYLGDKQDIMLHPVAPK